MSPVHDYQDQEFDYQVSSRSQRSAAHTQSKRPRYSRAGKQPQSFNGIHRRRRKKIRW